MNWEATLLGVYLVVGLAFAIGSIVYVSSMLNSRPDMVDGVFMAAVAVPVMALWPIVLVGVALTSLSRRVYDSRFPVDPTG